MELNPLKWINDPLWTEVNRLTIGLMNNPTPLLELLFEIDPTLAARCYLDANPDNVKHSVIKKQWTERIDRKERIKIVCGIKENLNDEQEVLDFIAGIFLTGETDTEVLYHCDKLLLAIGTDESKQVSRHMFDHWPEERQYQTYKHAFAEDEFWKLANIEGGEFEMGGHWDSEKTIHSVKIAPFQLGCFAVTVAQYERFNPGQRKEMLNDEFGEYDRQPVVRVSWYDAYIFCKWVNGRLPSEAEWEFAARGGIKSKGYKYSGSNTEDLVAWSWIWPREKTFPVGMKQSNELGIYDMSGNVDEWCQDKWHKNYVGAPTDGSAWEAGTSSVRVVRGLSGYPTRRKWEKPGGRFKQVGFRLVFVS